MYQLILQNNLSEILSYDDPGFMLRSYMGDLHEYVNEFVPAHWHRELEFIFIVEGTAVYHVNTRKYTLHAGEALLVNSNRLHYGYSPDHSNFVYSVLQFHPDFVESRPIRQDYLNRIIRDTNLDASQIIPDSPEREELLHCIGELIRLNLDRPGDFQLITMSRFYELILKMKDAGLIHELEEAGVSTQIPSLQSMLEYIQEHYTEPIRLADIAAAGAVCRSKCCEVFRQVLQQSPLDFVRSFRIQQSIRLLMDTDLSISEIAELSGFSKSSYYVESFHQVVGQTPKKYRTMIRERKNT